VKGKANSYSKLRDLSFSLSALVRRKGKLILDVSSTNNEFTIP
jgi:hypothetical protein